MIATSNEATSGGGVEPYISKAELGRRLGVAPRTVDAWMARGLLPYVKAGRAVRFRWSKVQAHLENNFEVNGDAVRTGKENR